MTELIASQYSHYIIIGCSVLGLVWGGVNATFVSVFPFTRAARSPRPPLVHCPAWTAA